MIAASPLEGRHRWLTNLSTFAVLAGLLIATAYTWVTIQFPEGTRLVLGVTLAVVIVVFNLTGDAIEQRRLSTLRALG